MRMSTHAYITRLHIMSIQPVNKAVLGRKKKRNAFLIKNSKGVGGGDGEGGGGALSQAGRRTGRSCMGV